MIRLTNQHGQTLDISPGTGEELVFLSVHLRPKGIRLDYLPDRPDGKYGLTSATRIADLKRPLDPVVDRPPMSPLGEALHGEFTTLHADAGDQLAKALDTDLDRQIKGTGRG